MAYYLLFFLRGVLITGENVSAILFFHVKKKYHFSFRMFVGHVIAGRGEKNL